MANFIGFIRGLASRASDRRAADPPGGSGCAGGIDPSPAIESLAMPRQWNTGGDLADAYRSGCWQRSRSGTGGDGHED